MSSSSSTSSISSWSSESSEWDVDWYSTLWCPEPQPISDVLFAAKVRLDLRYSDAVILSALGPALIEFGGPDAGTTTTTDQRDALDGLTVIKTFETYAGARVWQDRITQDLRASLRSLREIYLAQHPGDFVLRHRRV